MVAPVPAQISKLRPHPFAASFPLHSRLSDLPTFRHFDASLFPSNLERPTSPSNLEHPTSNLCLYPSSGPRNARIPSALNSLRILPVATGVCEKDRRRNCSSTNSFRIDTCKSVSKQMTLTPFRINTRPLLLPLSHAPRSDSIPSILNQLRIPPIATGVCPLRSFVGVIVSLGPSRHPKVQTVRSATWTWRAHPTIIAASSRFQVHG